MCGQLLIDDFFVHSSSFWEIGHDRQASGRSLKLAFICRARIRAAFSMLDGSGVASEVAGASEDEAEHSQDEVGGLFEQSSSS